jgi:hypothetical protein
LLLIALPTKEYFPVATQAPAAIRTKIAAAVWNLMRMGSVARFRPAFPYMVSQSICQACTFAAVDG